jgi:predicted ArsR family transcriptional regulator
MKRPFGPARFKQAPGAKRRATIAALIEQHRARTGEVLQAPDIAKILAMSPARVVMHLEALAQAEKRTPSRKVGFISSSSVQRTPGRSSDVGKLREGDARAAKANPSQPLLFKRI